AVLAPGRDGLRDAVPVGLEADRPRPRARRRQVPAPLARPPHGGPGLDEPALDHAALPVAADEADLVRRPPRTDARAPARRPAVLRGGGPGRRRARAGAGR